MTSTIRRIPTLLLAIGALLLGFAPPAAAEDPGQIFFPIEPHEQLRYSNTWGAPRSGGRRHKGVDMLAPQMVPLYAAQGGTVFAYRGDCAVGQYCSSYYLLISGDDGRSYFYVHMNNDTPGRPSGCDGRGGAENAFSPELVQHLRTHGTLKGMRVERGQHVGYNGSSGNAGCRVDHLHFEVWNGHGWNAPAVNPYPVVRAAHDAGNVPSSLPDPESTTRLRGEDRVATSIAVSRDSFDTASVAVVVNGAKYTDALVAAPLAAALGGPTLLLNTTSAPTAVDGRVAEELRRLGVQRVIVVGGELSVPDSVRQDLAGEAGIAAEAVQRVSGKDAYDTSAEVARAVFEARGVATAGSSAVQMGGDVSDRAKKAAGTAPFAMLAIGERPGGDGWPDALVASVLAAREIAPVLLTRPDTLSPATGQLLEDFQLDEVRVVGGRAAVSGGVEEAVNALGHDTRRLAGPDRWGTAASVATEFSQLAGIGQDRVAVATGFNFPDALSAGPGLAESGVPLLLVDGRAAAQPGPVDDWIRSRADVIDEVVTLGGDGAVSARTEDRVARLANWPS